mgnify:CR=1 FL=1
MSIDAIATVALDDTTVSNRRVLIKCYARQQTVLHFQFPLWSSHHTHLPQSASAEAAETPRGIIHAAICDLEVEVTEVSHAVILLNPDIAAGTLKYLDAFEPPLRASLLRGLVREAADKPYASVESWWVAL